MGRALLLTLALALAAGNGAGCSSAPTERSLSLFDRFRDQHGPNRVARAESSSSAPKRAELNPAGRKPPSQKVTAAYAEAERNSEAPAEAKADATQEPAIRKLIDEEMRDAGPEEYAELMEDLQGLQPAMIRQILQVRRLVKQMGQHAPSQQIVAKGAAEKGGHALTVQQVGGELPAASPSPARMDAGLGAVSPWGGPAENPATRVANRLPQNGGYSFDAAGPASNPSRLPFTQPSPWNGGSYGQGASTVTANQVAKFPNDYPGTPPQTAAAVYPGALPPPPLPAAAITPAPVPSGPPNAPFPPPAPATELATAPVTLAPLQPIDSESPQGSLLSAPPGTEKMSSAAPNLASAAWADEIRRVIVAAEAQIAQLPLGERPTEEQKQQYIEQHVYLRMLYLMSGQQERALTAIPKIDPADQEFWQQMFWAVANYFDAGAMPDRGDRASQTIAQLRQAVRRLQENARLELRNVTFCHKIASFGSYERFDRDEFSPGQPVLVYAEVGNFRSEPTADGNYRTLLRSGIEIFKAGSAGDLVERMEFGNTEDLCRNHRRDYFHSYEFTLPQNLTLGPHVLKLTVEDLLSQKVATYTVNFTVR